MGNATAMLSLETAFKGLAIAAVVVAFWRAFGPDNDPPTIAAEIREDPAEEIVFERPQSFRARHGI